MAIFSKLIVSQIPTDNERFGYTVEQRGRWLAISNSPVDFIDGVGKIYLYYDEGAPNGWVYRQTLLLTDAFAWSGSRLVVRISPDQTKLAVGAFTANANKGRVYLFENTNDTWAPAAEATLVSPSIVNWSAEGYGNGGINWRFGFDLALTNDTLLVTQNPDNGWFGKAYAYHWTTGPGGLTFEADLTPTGLQKTYYGYRVVVDESSIGTETLRVAIARRGEHDYYLTSGGVYLWTRTTGPVWTVVDTLWEGGGHTEHDPNPTVYLMFGDGLALDSGKLVVRNVPSGWGQAALFFYQRDVGAETYSSTGTLNYEQVVNNGDFSRLKNSTFLFGGPQQDSNRGYCSVVKLVEVAWTFVDSIYADPRIALGNFGNSVALDTIAAIGADNGPDPGSLRGAVYIYDVGMAIRPIADFTATNRTGLGPLTVLFADNSQNNPTSWLWDFDDGQTYSGPVPPPHEYSQPGIYSPRLTVSNDAGTDTTTQQGYIVVLAPSMPTSTLWTCMDVGLSNMPSMLLFSEVLANRGAPNIVAGADLLISSQDSALSQLKINLPIDQNHTFESVFTLSNLPPHFEAPAVSRLFIGVYDAQDNASGILFSRQGLAFVAGSTDLAIPASGSSQYVREGEQYILRLVVNGVDNTMDVYLTPVADAAIGGQQLLYTVPAPQSPDGSLDSVVIEALGVGGAPSGIRFTELRMNCVSCLTPNQRPIADAGPDRTAAKNTVIGYDGRTSYDPEGAALTYRWSLWDVPNGSRYKITGLGSTTDDGDHDYYTTKFTCNAAFGVDTAPLLQPGDLLVVEVGEDSYAAEVSTVNWLWNSTTQRYDRTQAFNINTLELVQDAIPDSLTATAFRVVHSRTYFDDYQLAIPSAQPDVTGIYAARLVVNDGQLDSLPTDQLTNVSANSLYFGYTPDLSWIWKYLSDFWSMVADREVIETVWSGFSQVIAAQLLTAWQIDYNKSLIDIQRVFQRRWLDYQMRHKGDPDTAIIRIIRGPIYSTQLTGLGLDGLTLDVVIDGGLIETVMFQGSTLTPQQVADQINQQLGFPPGNPLVVVRDSRLVFRHPRLLQIRGSGTANSVFGFSTAGYTQNDLRGTAGKQYALQATAFIDDSVPPTDFTGEGVAVGDLLVRGGLGYRVRRLPSPSTTLVLQEALQNPGVDQPWLVSSIITSTIDFEAVGVNPGDLVLLTCRKAGQDDLTVLCEITACRSMTIGFDPLPLLSLLQDRPQDWTIKFEGVKFTQYLPISDLIQEVPRLQEVIKDPPTILRQNADYRVEQYNGKNTLHFNSGMFSLTDPPPDVLWAEVTYLDNRPAIEANFGALVNFRVEDLATRTDDLDYLSAVRGLWWAYFGGPAVSRIRAGVQILLGLPFAEADGTITEIRDNFSATEGRILIRDSKDTAITRSYFYPKTAGLGLNPSTGVVFREGDAVTQFTPLSGGVDIEDYEINPEFLGDYTQFQVANRLQQYFKFVVRGNLDTFNITNWTFALDFVRKIKPHYSSPIFALLKNVPTTEVTVQDYQHTQGILHFYDSFASILTTGAFRWDDSDESGQFIHHYDEAPPRFLHDTHRLHPVDHVWVIQPYDVTANSLPFDSLWAFDNGDRDGDTISDDTVPLSGPDSSPPAPYGPLVGSFHFDTSYPNGRYWRARTL